MVGNFRIEWEPPEPVAGGRGVGPYGDDAQRPVIIVYPRGDIAMSPRSVQLLNQAPYVLPLHSQSGVIGFKATNGSDPCRYTLMAGKSHRRKDGTISLTQFVRLACKKFALKYKLARPEKIVMWMGTMVDGVLVFDPTSEPYKTFSLPSARNGKE